MTTTNPHQGPQLIATLLDDPHSITVEARSTLGTQTLAFAVRQTLRTVSLQGSFYDATVKDLPGEKVLIRFEDGYEPDFAITDALLWSIATRFSKINAVPIADIDLITQDRGTAS